MALRIPAKKNHPKFETCTRSVKWTNNNNLIESSSTRESELPWGKSPLGHCRWGSHEGSSCSDPRSMRHLQEGSTPMRSSCCRTRRHSSKWCSPGTCSSYHTRKGASREKEGMAPGSAGSAPSWSGRTLPRLSHTYRRAKQCCAPSWCTQPHPTYLPTSFSQSSSPFRSHCRSLRLWLHGLVKSHSFRWISPEIFQYF